MLKNNSSFITLVSIENHHCGSDESKYYCSRTVEYSLKGSLSILLLAKLVGVCEVLPAMCVQVAGRRF